MKKTLLKRLLSLGLAVSMLFGFTACQGKSAYEIAQETQNFQGTKEEWLQSLKGADGKDAAKLTIQEIYQASGYQGTLQEFIKDYLEIEIFETNETSILSKNVLSVMSVVCAFNVQKQTGENWFGKPEYKDSIQSSGGSAVILKLDKENGNATLITNYHVVYDSSSTNKNGISNSIWVYPYGGYIGYNSQTGVDESGKGIQAFYVGGAMDYDIAVLEIKGSEVLKNSIVEEAVLGDSEEIALGEKTFVIGNAEADGISVTSGVLSAQSEYIDMYSFDGQKREVEFRVMRTSAAVNHGNSGGGMFNAYGQLIGMVNAKNVEDDVENMGYALPINHVIQVVNNILDNHGVLKRALFGVKVQTIDSYPCYDEKGNLKIVETIQVYEPATQDASSYNKLQKGDIFKTIQVGEKVYPITRMYTVNDVLLGVRLGDSVVVTVERNGVDVPITIKFDKQSYFTVYA